MKNDMVEKDLSSCEKLIMKILWDSEEDVSTPDMMDLLNKRYGRDYARTTVVTFVQRLGDKGYVSTYRKGNVSFIHAEKAEEQYLDNMVDFWSKGGNCWNLLSSICKKGKLTKEEKAKMRKLIDEMDD